MTTVQTRIVPTKESISFPVLTFTDALPRDDLQSLKDGHIGERGILKWEFSQPKTSTQEPAATDSTFDFGLTASPAETVALAPSEQPDHTQLGPPGIGIALSSPGMLKSQNSPPPPRFYTSISAQPQKEDGMPTRKSSKWKKIGGLFKAKNALVSPTHDTKLGCREEPAANGRTALDSQMSRRGGSTEDWRRGDVRPKASINNTASPRRMRNFSLSTTNISNDHTTSEHPRLDVEIPDIQLERYSVMFSNVMDKNERPSLLARRSKTLDNLRVPDAEPFLAAKGNPVPRRRATSPANSNFTLFPISHPPKAAKVLGTQSYSHTPVPLTRAETSSGRNSLERSLKPHRAYASNHTDSTSSIDSQNLLDLVSERSKTPSSFNRHSRNQEKPLPALKTEQSFQSQAKRVPPQAVQVAQSIDQEEHSSRQVKPQRTPSPPQSRRNHLNLTINTDATKLRPPAAKVDIASSSDLTLEESPSNSPEDQEELVLSPSPILADSKHTTLSKSTISPKENPDDLNTRDHMDHLPAIVSMARSISVKKGTRQVLVPIGARVDHLNPNERLVERKALMPRVTDVRYGHRHVVSQELQIESL